MNNRKSLLLSWLLIIVLGIFLTTGCEPEDTPSPNNNGEGNAAANEESNTDNTNVPPPEEMGEYPDGTYRGAFHDRGTYLGDQIGLQQVGIQFTLENNQMQDLSFRVLAWNGDNYMVPDDPNNQWPQEDLEVLKEQHEEAIDYLEGKNITEISDLYEPDQVAENKEGTGEIKDTWTAATMRGNKILHAIRDALNKGVYVPADQ